MTIRNNWYGHYNGHGIPLFSEGNVIEFRGAIYCRPIACDVMGHVVIHTGGQLEPLSMAEMYRGCLCRSRQDKSVKFHKLSSNSYWRTIYGILWIFLVHAMGLYILGWGHK